jgi:hypothetical protein
MRELEEDWSVDDVMDAHDVLDFRDWMELQAAKKAPKPRSKGGR